MKKAERTAAARALVSEWRKQWPDTTRSLAPASVASLVARIVMLWGKKTVKDPKPRVRVASGGARNAGSWTDRRPDIFISPASQSGVERFLERHALSGADRASGNVRSKSYHEHGSRLPRTAEELKAMKRRKLLS